MLDFNEALGPREPFPAEQAPEIEAVREQPVIVPGQQPLPAAVDQLLLFAASLRSVPERKRTTRQRLSPASGDATQLGLF
jgi:hypothetical protein